MSVFSPSVRMCDGDKKKRRRGFHTVKLADISTFTSLCEPRNEEIVCVWCVGGWVGQGGEKNLLSLCILQSGCYHPPGLFYSDFPSVMHAFQRGRGLLVQADWTSQCCELEWHSVMDDLPHADPAKSLAHCCRVFLTVKIHTALGQDRLILTKSITESQHSGRGFLLCYNYVRGSESTAMVCIPWGPPPSVHTVKPCMRGTCQDKI